MPALRSGTHYDKGDQDCKPIIMGNGKLRRSHRSTDQGNMLVNSQFTIPNHHQTTIKQKILCNGSDNELRRSKKRTRSIPLMTEGVFIDSDDEQKNDREYEGSTHPSDRKSFVKYAVVSSNIQSVHLEEQHSGGSIVPKPNNVTRENSSTVNPNFENIENDALSNATRNGDSIVPIGNNAIIDVNSITTAEPNGQSSKQSFQLIDNEAKLREMAQRLSLRLEIQKDTSTFYLRLMNYSPSKTTMTPTKNHQRVLMIADLGQEAIRITKYLNAQLVDEEVWPKAGGNWLHLFEALLCGICFEFFGLKVRYDA